MTSQLICPAVNTLGEVLQTMLWLEIWPAASGLVVDEGGV